MLFGFRVYGVATSRFGFTENADIVAYSPRPLQVGVLTCEDLAQVRRARCALSISFDTLLMTDGLGEITPQVGQKSCDAIPSNMGGHSHCACQKRRDVRSCVLAAPDLRRRAAPISQPSGVSPVKCVNLSARPARAYNSTRANVRPVARSVRPDLRRRRNRSACAVHVRGTFAACGVRARPSGALSVPTCGASCAACRAPCAVPDVRRNRAACRLMPSDVRATSSGATVRPITRRVPSGLSPVKGVNLSARPACAVFRLSRFVPKTDLHQT